MGLEPRSSKCDRIHEITLLLCHFCQKWWWNYCQADLLHVETKIILGSIVLVSETQLILFASNLALVSVFSPYKWCYCDFFTEISSHNDKLIWIVLFPWLGVDPTVVLHLKEGLNRAHHLLNRTMVKKMKKDNEEEAKSQEKKNTLPWMGL